MITFWYTIYKLRSHIKLRGIVGCEELVELIEYFSYGGVLQCLL